MKSAVAAALAATCISAQPIIDYDAMPTPRQTIQADLNNDGMPETISVFGLNDTFDVITIDDRYPRQAFIVPINLSDFQSLEIAANGNLLVNYGCFACGRTHSHTTLTIRLQDDTLQVIGYDHSYADRLFAAVMDCSVNLLTGDAIVRSIDVDTQQLSTPERAYPVRDIIARAGPQICTDGFARYDDDFLRENYPQD